jgi:hypothetical protein
MNTDVIRRVWWPWPPRRARAETAPAVLAAASVVNAAPGATGRSKSLANAVETLRRRCSSSRALVSLPASSADRRKQAKMPLSPSWGRRQASLAPEKMPAMTAWHHPHSPVLAPTPHRAIGNTLVAASDGAQRMLDKMPTRSLLHLLCCPPVSSCHTGASLRPPRSAVVCSTLLRSPAQRSPSTRSKSSCRCNGVVALHRWSYGGT